MLENQVGGWFSHSKTSSIRDLLDCFRVLLLVDYSTLVVIAFVNFTSLMKHFHKLVKLSKF